MHTRSLLLLAALAVAGCSSGGSSTDAAPSATRISITGGRPGVLPTQTLQLTATAYDGTGAAIASPATFAWSSSATNVATVDQTGKVTAVAAGQTTIAAALGTLSGSYLLTVDPSAATLRVPALP